MKKNQISSSRIVLFSFISFVFVNSQINKSSGQALAFNDKPVPTNSIQSSPVVITSLPPAVKPGAVPSAEPLFPGGEDSLQRYLFLHIAAPDSLYKRDISGSVYFSFFVETDGKVDRVKIEKGPSAGWDSATIQCIRTMPNWIPGVINDKPKAMRCFLPVSVPPGHELYNMPDSISIK
ncbi:MAG TPA: energy transducer TonB [Bacteroidia bacterium]|nr:energy transducer TonB [Bacteroidia bacterium]